MHIIIKNVTLSGMKGYEKKGESRGCLADGVLRMKCSLLGVAAVYKR